MGGKGHISCGIEVCLESIEKTEFKKRCVLHTTTKLFNPVGIIYPVFIQAKSPFSKPLLAEWKLGCSTGRNSEQALETVVLRTSQCGFHTDTQVQLTQLLNLLREWWPQVIAKKSNDRTDDATQKEPPTMQLLLLSPFPAKTVACLPLSVFLALAHTFLWGPYVLFLSSTSFIVVW